eukprot:212996-Prorocentrum_minimum.AAC.2
MGKIMKEGQEQICRSSLDAREPQNPTVSEEYRSYLQGVLYGTRGAQKSKTRCYQRCEHPGFSGGSGGGQDGVRRGSGGAEVVHRLHTLIGGD